MSEKCRHLAPEMVVTDHEMMQELKTRAERSGRCAQNRHDLRHCANTNQARCVGCQVHMDWPPIVRPDIALRCPVHES